MSGQGDQVIHANLANEEAVLGSALLAGQIIGTLLADLGLRGEHFYRERNRDVFAAMTDLFDRGDPIDELSVIGELRERGVRWADDLDSFVHALPNTAPPAFNYRHYAKLVIEDSVWRHRQHALMRAQAAINTRDETALAAAEADLAGSDARDAERTSSPQQLAHKLLEWADATEDEDGWPFPWEKLTRLTAGGMRREQVTLIGGWTSHGKTVVIDQCLEHATKHGARVRLFTNEMRNDYRVMRRVSRETGIGFHRLVQKQFRDEQERSQFTTAVTRYAQEGFPIVSAAGMSADEIGHDILRHRPDVAGVDILHEIDYADETDLRRIGQTFNRVARQAGCHILATVHLNDGRATGPELPPPVLRDIKGASALRQGSDNVMFLWRKNDGEEIENEGRIYFSKVRNGMLGGLDVVFQESRMRFILPATPGTVGTVAA